MEKIKKVHHDEKEKNVCLETQQQWRTSDPHNHSCITWNSNFLFFQLINKVTSLLNFTLAVSHRSHTYPELHEKEKVKESNKAKPFLSDIFCPQGILGNCAVGETLERSHSRWNLPCDFVGWGCGPDGSESEA